MAEDDFEVEALYERLKRWQFEEISPVRERHNYSLDVTTDGFRTEDGELLMKAILKSPNDLMRMDLKTTYRSYRNDWYQILNQAIPKPLRPRKPLSHARVMFQIFSNRPENQLLDAEAKYSAVKPLMDCLQPPTQFSGSGQEVTRMGIGILADDTDGEHFRAGVVMQLEVFQRKVAKVNPPRIRLVIDELKPWF